MKANSKALLAVIMALAAFAETALSKDYIVGDSEGWGTNFDYNAWAAGITFVVGDTITFKYEVFHDVLEVTQANYEACTPTNALATYSGGDTTVALTSPGTRYFICGIPFHCGTGRMKLKVATLASASSTAVSPSPAPLASPPAKSYKSKKKNAPSPAPAPGPPPPADKLAMATEASPAVTPATSSSTGAAVARHVQPVVAVATLALAILAALAV